MGEVANPASHLCPMELATETCPTRSAKLPRAGVSEDSTKFWCKDAIITTTTRGNEVKLLKQLDDVFF